MKKDWYRIVGVAIAIVTLSAALAIPRPMPVDSQLIVLKEPELNTSIEYPSLIFDTTERGLLPLTALNPNINSRGALVGQSWADRQAISSMGRTVAINPTTAPHAGVHMCWTTRSGPLSGSKWAYSSFDPIANSYLVPGGQVIPMPSGPVITGYYPRLAIQRNGAAALGGFDALGNDWVIWDNTFGAGTFPGTCGVLPTPPTIWPTMDWTCLAGDTIMYLAVFENTGTPGRSASMRVFRNVKSGIGCLTWQIVLSDYSSYPSQDISCNPATTEVAVAWTKPVPFGGKNKDNDVWYADSPTGLPGTWTTHNLTNFAPTSNGYRPWMELSTLFDSSGRFHVAWNAALKSGIPGMLTWFSRRCRLFHWSEWNPSNVYTIYSSESNTLPQCYGGSNVMNVGHLSIGECNSQLYTIFSAFNDQNLTTWTDDCCQSAPSWRAANGDVFVSTCKTLGGTGWDRPRNLSSSYTPNCDTIAGSGCADDRWGAIARIGMTDASYAGTENWTNAMTFDPSGSYTGGYYTQVFYETDRYPGSWTSTPSEGPASLNDMRWIRLACVPPISRAFIVRPWDTLQNVWTKTGIQKKVTLRLQNIGTADANYSGVVVHEDSARPAAPMGWFTASYGLSPIPEGGSTTIDVYLNSLGMIVTQPVVAWGRVSYIYTSVGGTDTLEIPVSITVADSVVTTITTDIIATPDFNLSVSSNANMGNCWEGGVNMDYTGHGECDTGFNSRGDALVYLGDASPVIVRKEGAGMDQAIGDINGSCSMYLGGKGRGLLPIPPPPPSPIMPFTSLPIGPGPGSTSTSRYLSFSTGTLCTIDSLVKIVNTWWAPQSADSSNFIIQRTQVFPYNIGSPVSNLQIGFAADWDIPSDSEDVNNFGGYDSPRRMMWMRGFNSSDAISDCANNSTRYAGAALLMMHRKDKVLDSALRNAMNIPNDQFVYPNQNFVSDSLWALGGIAGYYAESRVTDQTTLFTFKGGPTGYTLAANDTLTIWTALATVKSAASTSAGLDSLKKAIDKARAWYLPLRDGGSCCAGMTGNVNMAGIVDLADLSALVSYLTGGGFVLPCVQEANVNNSGIVDLADLSALVSYLTGGGFLLPNCP